MSKAAGIASRALRGVANLRSSRLPPELVKSTTALLSSVPLGGKHTLPDLPYDYGALEPVISAETMTIHHTKHHNTYVTNLNASLEKLDAAVTAGDVSGIIGLQSAINFNGGGHVNHSLFWENLCPPGSPQAELKAGGSLAKAIDESFGGLDGMKQKLVPATIAIQGSGWGWVGYNKSTGLLEVTTRANQDPLEATTGLVPIFGIDVWEHAYYVDYRNVRPDYVNATFDKIINYETAETRYLAAK